MVVGGLAVTHVGAQCSGRDSCFESQEVAGRNRISILSLAAVFRARLRVPLRTGNVPGVLAVEVTLDNDHDR